MEWDCRLHRLCAWIFLLPLLLTTSVQAQLPLTTPLSPLNIPPVGPQDGNRQSSSSLVISASELAGSFKIEKEVKDPSHLLNIHLPSTFQHFHQFIARVSDVSPALDARQRDANRTFVASTADGSLINIHGLSPGHEYVVAVLGRRAEETVVIKEESVTMDPLPLDFGASTSQIEASHTNITMRAVKVEHALQGTFRVEYMQLEPVRRYPILDVHDINEQKEVELYLGNLNPGRDYQITVTSLQAGQPSQPWQGVVTTRPLVSLMSRGHVA